MLLQGPCAHASSAFMTTHKDRVHSIYYAVRCFNRDSPGHHEQGNARSECGTLCRVWKGFDGHEKWWQGQAAAAPASPMLCAMSLCYGGSCCVKPEWPGPTVSEANATALDRRCTSIYLRKFAQLWISQQRAAICIGTVLCDNEPLLTFAMWAPILPVPIVDETIPPLQLALALPTTSAAGSNHGTSMVGLLGIDVPMLALKSNFRTFYGRCF